MAKKVQDMGATVRCAVVKGDLIGRRMQQADLADLGEAARPFARCTGHRTCAMTRAARFVSRSAAAGTVNMSDAVAIWAICPLVVVMSVAIVVPDFLLTGTSTGTAHFLAVPAATAATRLAFATTGGTGLRATGVAITAVLVVEKSPGVDRAIGRLTKCCVQ